MIISDDAAFAFGHSSPLRRLSFICSQLRASPQGHGTCELLCFFPAGCRHASHERAHNRLAYQIILPISRPHLHDDGRLSIAIGRHIFRRTRARPASIIFTATGHASDATRCRRFHAASQLHAACKHACRLFSAAAVGFSPPAPPAPIRRHDKMAISARYCRRRCRHHIHHTKPFTARRYSQLHAGAAAPRHVTDYRPRPRHFRAFTGRLDKSRPSPLAIMLYFFTGRSI